jgi:hypothetical protein
VKTPVSKEASSPAAAVTPARFRYFINKASYFMVEVTTLSSGGSVMSRAEIRNVTVQPGLADSFFQLPPGLEVKTPTSPAAYMDLVVGLLKPKTPIQTSLNRRAAPTLTPRPHVAPDRPLPSQILLARRDESEATPSLKPKSFLVGHKLLVANAIVLLLVLLGLFVFRRRSSTRGAWTT